MRRWEAEERKGTEDNQIEHRTDDEPCSGREPEPLGRETVCNKANPQAANSVANREQNSQIFLGILGSLLVFQKMALVIQNLDILILSALGLGRGVNCGELFPI